ncbi:ketopantoate reductase family protein [Aestuariibacter salexigens]|uniref:ketopantoate reductase family protein n=1 Tax=Aestuariibacter salexigens TaxID=226010 RepID=UPI0004154235|nr:2-dehydropantoate 2-reductase [Aestuariibacter salexigens]
MLIGIVGTGAIGSLLATQAALAGLNCVVIPRRERNNTNGHIALSRSDLAAQSFTLPIATNNQLSRLDVVIVPTKAYQVEQAICDINAHLRPHTAIVLLHNGIGPHEVVQQLCPDNPIVGATTSYAALKTSAQTVTMTGSGQTDAGWLANPQLTIQDKLLQMLNSLLPPCNWHQDVLWIMLKKLSVNAVINPLTALNNVKNGALCDAHYSQSIQHLCEQTSNVFNALGYPVSTAALQGYVTEVAQLTANNYSSMHQDLAHKRRTEIDFINGFIVREAKRHRMAVPDHQKLVTAIHRQESHYR